MWELIKELVNWTGWFPITIAAVIVMLLGRYFYDRETKFKDLQIDKLKYDLEDSKQYRVDVLVQNLTQRVHALNKALEELNNEKNTEEHQRKTIEQEKESIVKQLEIAHSDIMNLRERLKSYEDDLDDLIDDYCQICDPDQDVFGGNIIFWGSAVYPLTGLDELVERVGSCNYCNSPQMKCSVCGSITSLDLDEYEKVECAGECGVMYQLVIDYREHDYEIEVSRKDD